MKKGLLTVLAASLVFVGCQNYDDQFDDLNAQISALKSQVDGLSSLSGQVASLSGTISGLQSGISAAQAAATAAGTSATAATAAANAIDLTGLAASLATLETDVAAVQASLVGISTAAAVATLQTEIDAIELDLQELLDATNIYDTAISVTSASTLDAALALGNKVNILNAAATFTVTTAMDQAKVQTLVNRIHTMTGDLTFNSSSTTETTFNNLTSAEAITINQKGGYQFGTLTSAAAITLNDQYEANITGTIDFGDLVTVTSFTTSGETDAGIQFDQATELDLGSLVRYPGTQLTIITKKDATLTMSLLDDLNLLSVYEATHITMTGPKSFTTTLLDDSTMSFTTVETVSVTDNRGAITIGAGVETLTLVDVVEVTVGAAADDLVTASIDFKADDEPSLTAAQTAALNDDADAFVANDKGDIDLTTLANLTTVTISGISGDINIDQNPNLESVTVTADGHDLYVVDNDNMTSVTLTGAKLSDIEVSGHADLVTLTLDHTTSLSDTSSSAAEKAVGVNVNTNASLTTLTSSVDDIDELQVYTNAVLTTVDFTGLSDDGTATTSWAHFYNNNLTYDLVKDGYDTGTTYTLTDTGSTTGGGGIKTLKTWLQHVDGAINATYGLYVYVDAITKYEVQSTLGGTYTDTAVPSAPSVTTQATGYSNRTSLYAVTALEAAETSTTYTDGSGTVSETQVVAIPITNNATYAAKTVLEAAEGIAINLSSLSKTFKKGDTYSGSTVSTVADLISYVNGDTSWGSDITLTATNTGYFRSNQTVNYTLASDGSAETVSLIGTSLDGDKLWFKLGSTHISGTITLTAGEAATDIAKGIAGAISGMKNTSQAYTYGAAFITAGTLAITKRVSIAGYPDDITTGVSSIPAISFVIDAAQTSTTIGLNATATSNSASNGNTGSTSGFFLTITQNDVAGMTVKFVNSNTAQAKLAAIKVSSINAYAGTTASGTLGATGTTGTTSQTLMKASSTMSFLVSNTHFIGPNTAYAALFADVSVGTTTTSQAAAVTNRSGWL